MSMEKEWENPFSRPKNYVLRKTVSCLELLSAFSHEWQRRSLSVIHYPDTVTENWNPAFFLPWERKKEMRIWFLCSQIRIPKYCKEKKAFCFPDILMAVVKWQSKKVVSFYDAENVGAAALGLKHQWCWCHVCKMWSCRSVTFLGPFYDQMQSYPDTIITRMFFLKGHHFIFSTKLNFNGPVCVGETWYLKACHLY